MPQLNQPIKHILALALFCGCCAQPGFAQSTEEEDYIQIQYRTLGWGLQTSLMTPVSKDPLIILNSQFSTQQQYIGPKVIRFYKSNAQDQGIMEDDVFPIPSSADPAVETNILGPDVPRSKSSQTTPPVLAEVTIPDGMRQVLFIFIEAAPGSKYPMAVVAMDDSIARTDSQNVHFYNLTPIELVVKTFDQIQTVKPKEQSVWELKRGENKSSIAIAITNPETKLVYSTRYRMRENSRMIAMARLKSKINADEIPQIHVTLLTEKIQNSAQSIENGHEFDVLPTD